jgi:hypothetical protein
MIANFSSQGDEFIGGVAAGTDDHDDLIPPLFGAQRTPGRRANTFRCSDATAAKFLYHQSQCPVLLRRRVVYFIDGEQSSFLALPR